METKQQHPAVAKLWANANATVASERSAAPPVDLSPRQPATLSPDQAKQYEDSVKAAEGDAPTKKDVVLTSSDDYAVYLPDINESYDLAEQAFQLSLIHI